MRRSLAPVHKWLNSKIGSRVAGVKIILEFNYISVLFVAVYLFQMIFSLWLDQLNRRHLADAGKEIPAAFEGFIDQNNLSKMNSYTIDRSRLFQTRKIISDILLLAFILSGFFLCT